MLTTTASTGKKDLQRRTLATQIVKDDLYNNSLLFFLLNLKAELSFKFPKKHTNINNQLLFFADVHFSIAQFIFVALLAPIFGADQFNRRRAITLPRGIEGAHGIHGI